MLSKTIRDAATSGKYNEFDLETWAHEAWKKEQRMRDLDVENAELREALEKNMAWIGRPPIDKYSFDNLREEAWALGKKALDD